MDNKQHTVLVVDDAADNIQLISGILKPEYKVKAATSGEKALKIAFKSPPPDAILLDIIMPEMDGFEVCAAIRDNASTAAVPIIFISGNVSDDDQNRGRQAGGNAFLGKPVDAAELQSLLEEILNQGEYT